MTVRWNRRGRKWYKFKRRKGQEGRETGKATATECPEETWGMRWKSVDKDAVESLQSARKLSWWILVWTLSALRIFRHIGDVSMGLALESIVAIEEKTLLAAYVSMLLGRYDQAEQLFLKSTRPIEALAVSQYRSISIFIQRPRIVSDAPRLTGLVEGTRTCRTALTHWDPLHFSGIRTAAGVHVRVSLKCAKISKIPRPDI